MVATKAALSIRVDALTDVDGKSDEMAPSIGMANRAKLESRLRALEHQADSGSMRRFQENNNKQPRFEMTGGSSTYNTAADAVDLVPTQRAPLDIAVDIVMDVKAEKKRSKEERKAKKRIEQEAVLETAESLAVETPIAADEEGAKKRKRRESELNGQDAGDSATVSLYSLFFDRTKNLLESQVTETDAERKARKLARKAEKAAAAAANGSLKSDADATPKKKKRKSESVSTA